jgi:hypothetical protein
MASVRSIFYLVGAQKRLSAGHLFMQYLPVIFCLILACSAASAEEREIFYWDADSLDYVVEGSKSKCSKLMAGAIIDSSTKKSGRASLRLDLGDTQRDTGCEAVKTPEGAGLYDGDSIYWTTWIKISSDFNWGTYHRKVKFAHMKRSNQRMPVYGVIYIEHDGFHWEGKLDPTLVYLKVDLDPQDGSCSSAEFQNLQKECTEWRQYTVHLKQNSCVSCSDGVFEVFVDGVLADRVENVSFASEVPQDGVSTYKFAWAGLGGKAYPQMCANGESCPGVGGFMWLDEMSIRTSSDGPIHMNKPLPPEIQ